MKKFYKIFKNSDGDVEVQTLHLRRPGYPVTSRQVFTAAEVMTNLRFGWVSYVDAEKSPTVLEEVKKKVLDAS